MKPLWRSLWSVLCVLLIVHLLALAGGALWLWQSGRLTKERLQKAVEIFKPTLEQEAELARQAQAAAQEATQQQERLVQMLSAEKGVLTAEERIRLETRDDELLRQRIARLDRERQDLVRQLERAQEALTRQQQELEVQRQAFAAAVQQEVARRSDADFQLAVELYEQVRPRQAKQMFQELLAQGRTEQVVAYLAAMQLRKAAAVLKEFKEPAEIQQAAELVQHLRKRGVDPLAAAGVWADAQPADQGG